MGVAIGSYKESSFCDNLLRLSGHCGRSYIFIVIDTRKFSFSPVNNSSPKQTVSKSFVYHGGGEGENIIKVQERLSKKNVSGHQG